MAGSTFRIQTLTLDELHWTAIAPGIPCSQLVINNAGGIGDVKVRTDPDVPDEEETVIQGGQLIIGTAVTHDTARVRQRFLPGIPQAWAQLVGGTGVIKIWCVE